jgi:hypothetical protein
MDNSMTHPFEILFRDDESVFVGGLRDVETFSLEEAVKLDLPYFCVNPVSGGRGAANVTRAANLLFESDKGTLEAQERALEDSGLPYACLTFSGNKSLHAIVAISDRSLSQDEYKPLHALICRKLLESGFVADRACGNISRLSRTPYATNHTTERRQNVLRVRAAVSFQELLHWLGEVSLPREKTLRRAVKAASADMPPWILRMLEYGTLGESGSRRQTLFAAAKALQERGWEPEAVEKLLRPRCTVWFSPEELRHMGDIVHIKVREAFSMGERACE